MTHGQTQDEQPRKLVKLTEGPGSDFFKVLQDKSFYVDKSMFIKDFMDCHFKVSCILRPRGFGKSLNLSMLCAFYSIGAEPSMFEGLAISKEKEFVEQHCGKYPVVFLDLKDCKGDSWEEMEKHIADAIHRMIDRHTKLAKKYKKATERAFGPIDINDSLRWLTNELYKIHKKRVIVLIDEYDMPINNAALNGFYDKAEKFFSSFYSKGLKGNSSLFAACLVGILEIRASGILTGLNNFSYYDTSVDIFSAYFGKIS